MIFSQCGKDHHHLEVNIKPVHDRQTKLTLGSLGRLYLDAIIIQLTYNVALKHFPRLNLKNSFSLYCLISSSTAERLKVVPVVELRDAVEGVRERPCKKYK